MSSASIALQAQAGVSVPVRPAGRAAGNNPTRANGETDMFEVQHLREVHARELAGLTHELKRAQRRIRREHKRLERTFSKARLIPLDEDYVPPPREPMVRRGLTLLLALVLTLL